MTSPGASLAYDQHGNTTRLADQQLVYDVADRHVGTILDDGTTITYTLDAGGRMVARTVTGSPTTSENGTVRYLAGGATADSTGAVLQWVVGLPGGVTVSIDATTDDGTWGYPNLHGDVIVTADDTGTRQGARSVYDPFGQPIDPTTWAIGTTTADDTIPDLLAGDADFGWVGRHGKYTEHHGSIQTIEMGARQYVPALGRFLEVDPVEGGVTNAYDYPADPINKFDLTGMMIPVVLAALAVIAIVAILSTPSSTQQAPPKFGRGPKAQPPWPKPTVLGETAAETADRCAAGQCISNVVTSSYCHLFLCGSVSFNFREDKKMIVVPSFGIGLGIGGTIEFGTAFGVLETGSTASVGCSGALGLGFGIEASHGYPGLQDAGQWDNYSDSGAINGAWALGLGAGCSVDFLSATLPFDFS